MYGPEIYIFLEGLNFKIWRKFSNQKYDLTECIFGYSEIFNNNSWYDCPYIHTLLPRRDRVLVYSKVCVSVSAHDNW